MVSVSQASLYAGSAEYYTRGRMPYPQAVVEVLAAEAGYGRVLDVGCGPGSLSLPLARLCEEVVGIDADRGMVDQAALASDGLTNTRWLHLRAEDLPAGLGAFRLVTFAQSFHWMDRPRVAQAVHGMLAAGGVCAHIHATTHQGIETDAELPHPQPPHAAIAELVRKYLGPVRRAGNKLLPNGTASGEDEIYRAAGFTKSRRVEIPGILMTRTADDVVAAVFSLSSSTPHLLGTNQAAFEADLRHLLENTSPTGTFSELTHKTVIDLWRP
ncbi:Methyltransferase domain-containing protein [Actinokineospora diospyrosa]|uniref:Methyltransferase domain-containing protein n=1 Tax=Actinokineospora diospyrosa TaxID=103728 RepID=A0ABT1I6S4_9PSEU|nr:Methyltransferase domain-containing protein [Actinokineospora diospyrosa]